MAIQSVGTQENLLGKCQWTWILVVQDGILNFKETQKVLRCLGLRVSEDQASLHCAVEH